MIEQKAKVVRCQDSRILVRLGAQSGCAACDAGQGCGAGLFARLLQHGPAEFEVDRGDLDVVPGQVVTLALPERLYLKIVLAFYAWPLLAALVAALFVDNLLAGAAPGSAVLDGVTLAAALLAGGIALRATRSGASTDMLLRSLQLTVGGTSQAGDLCGVSRDETQSQ